MLRYSLATLLGVTVVTGVACAALVSPNKLWAQSISTIVVVSILFFSVAAIYARSGWRAFAGGFAICAAAYFFLVCLPQTSTLKPLLLTSQLMEMLRVQLPHGKASAGNNNGTFALTFVPQNNNTMQAGSGGGMGGGMGMSGGAPITVGGMGGGMGGMGGGFGTTTSANFQIAQATVVGRWYDSIGHNLWALLIGVVGGVVARLCAGRAERDADEHASS